MGLVEILQNKRQAQLRDDLAILLLLLAKGATRPKDLKDESKLPKNTFWRAFSDIRTFGWAETVAVKSQRRGKFTACRLTAEGERQVRMLYAKPQAPPVIQRDDSLLRYFTVPSGRAYFTIR